MRRGSFVFPIFLFCLSLSLFFMLLASKGLLQFITDSIDMSLFPLSSLVRQIHLPQAALTDLDKLKQENARLASEVAMQNQLKQDNAALRDQFDTTTIASKTLLPVHIVGMPNVIPNISFPESLIIDAGVKESVTKDRTILIKDNAIGITTNASDHYANVQLITSRQSSFSVKSSQSGAIGVAKGQGNGEIIMDNILLSDTISIGDTVVTLGNQNQSGSGYPPNLIVGKVVSIEKNPSSLFQKARVVPFLHLDHLSTVFVVEK